MKLRITIKILLLVLVAVLTAGCGSAGNEVTTASAPVDMVSQSNVVSAEAFVVPLKESALSFETGGKVASIEVEEGDKVSKGQLLAQLDDAAQKAALEQAKSSLLQAQAALVAIRNQQMEATAMFEQAKAGLSRAEAILAETIAGATKEDIAIARARVGTAQAGLNKTLAGARDEDIQAVAASMLQAEANVRLAQADYDKFVFGEPKVAEPYGIALQQATLEYERTKAQYDKLVNGATKEDIAVSQAQLNEAKAALAKVLAGATPEQIAQSQAGVVEAEANIVTFKSRVDVANSNIKQSEEGERVASAGVALALAQLDKTTLKSPFDGTLSFLNLNEGEVVLPGMPAMFVGDSSNWQIETDDLTEIDAVNVRKGAAVTISVDALPGQELKGKVVRITPKSETKAGDVTYTVLIEITDGDSSKLRWGMTTFVDIDINPDL